MQWSMADSVVISVGNYMTVHTDLCGVINAHSRASIPQGLTGVPSAHRRYCLTVTVGG